MPFSVSAGKCHGIIRAFSGGNSGTIPRARGGAVIISGTVRAPAREADTTMARRDGATQPGQFRGQGLCTARGCRRQPPSR